MRVVLCFFGLVKNVSAEQCEAYRQCVVDPFRAKGIEVVAMMHTHKASVFSNARNREKAVRIDQARSIHRLRSLCPWMILMRTRHRDPSDEDLDSLLRNGDPWPDNPRQSVVMFLRQLDSLRNVARGLDVHGRPDDLLILLRPDVMFKSPLNATEILERHHLKPHMIQLPNWSKCAGLNDRLAIGSRSAMVPYLSRGDRLREYVDARNRPHAERFLHFAIREQAYSCISTRFLRVRADGREQPN